MPFLIRLLMSIVFRLPAAIVVSIVCLLAVPVWADFQAGLDASDSGDYITALQEWRPLAEQGHVRAQYSLGVLYSDGWVVPRDYPKARQWYGKAAAQGDADAQYSLASMYFFGQGGPVAIETAVGWYAKSAAQGNARAQVHLGGLYEFGIGVPQNEMRAYMWYSLAAEQSRDATDTYAADRRDNVFNRLNPAQLSEAQKQTREWKPIKN